MQNHNMTEEIRGMLIIINKSAEELSDAIDVLHKDLLSIQRSVRSLEAACEYIEDYYERRSSDDIDQ